MNRTRRLVLAAAIAIPLMGGAVTGLPTSSADDIPDACVYVAASVTGGTSVDESIDTDGNTCPPLPPTPPNECPEGTSQHVNPTVGPVEAEVLICVKDLL